MSLTLAGATALAAGISAAGSAVGIGAQAASNTRVAKLQNQFNIDMWNRTNEYNSPQAQMQRLSEAGLNPNLIYGNINNGNASPAHQVAPQPPNIQKGMKEIADAFNVENLLTLDANRRKAEAEANMAEINVANARDERKGQYDFEQNFYFDPSSGQFVEIPDTFQGGATSPATRYMRYLRDTTGSWDNSSYYYNMMRARNYQNLHLIPYRAALLEHQKQYLAPQVQMLQYQNKYYPYSFWIENANRGTGVLKNLFTLPYPF